MVAFLPKDSERIKQLEKALKDEQEKFKNFKKKRDEQISKVAYELGIPTQKLKTYEDYDDGILKAVDDLKTQNNTLKTQMDIALAYSPNTYAKELERMRQKRDKTAIILKKARRERDKARKERDKIAGDFEKAQDKISKLKEIAQAYQDEIIEQTPDKRSLVKKDPTVDTVKINNPLKKKPSKQDPDFDR